MSRLVNALVAAYVFADGMTVLFNQSGEAFNGVGDAAVGKASGASEITG